MGARVPQTRGAAPQLSRGALVLFLLTATARRVCGFPGTQGGANDRLPQSAAWEQRGYSGDRGAEPPCARRPWHPRGWRLRSRTGGVWDPGAQSAQPRLKGRQAGGGPRGCEVRGRRRSQTKGPCWAALVSRIQAQRPPRPSPAHARFLWFNRWERLTAAA